jgi:SulP family sulfate permease
MERVPAEFVDKLAEYGHHLGTWNPWALALGAGTILVVQLWPRYVTTKVPGSLIAIIATTALVQLAHVPVETIGSRFGEMPNLLPAPSLPSGVSWERMRELSSPALTIALLAAIESLLCAVVADGMIRAQHRSNMELVAQGIANLCSPLFQGICATGAIARTATNVKNGGRTPIAGMVHAVTLLLIMVLFARWAKLIPLATLAGVLLVVAYHMSEWRVFKRLLRSPRSDVLVLVVTFLLTVLIDLTVAIQVGVVLAAFLFMRRMAAITETDLVTQRIGEGGLDLGAPTDIPDGVEVFSVQGPFFFGAASKFKSALGRIQRPPRVLIFRLRDVPVIDATGLDALQDVFENAERNGTTLLLSGLQPQPRRALERAGLLPRIGAQNLCANIDHALARAKVVLGEPPRKRISGRLGAAH